MKTTVKLALKGPHRHVRSRASCSLVIGVWKWSRMSGQYRERIRSRLLRPVERIQSPGDSRGTDNRPVLGQRADLVGDVPDCLTIGLTHHLDAVHDSIPGEHVLVVQAKLIGQEGRRRS